MAEGSIHWSLTASYEKLLQLKIEELRRVPSSSAAYAAQTLPAKRYCVGNCDSTTPAHGLYSNHPRCIHCHQPEASATTCRIPGSDVRSRLNEEYGPLPVCWGDSDDDEAAEGGGREFVGRRARPFTKAEDQMIALDGPSSFNVRVTRDAARSSLPRLL